MDDGSTNNLLAGLVRAGDEDDGATAITDTIFMSRDVSNSYLLTTPEGDVLINAGMEQGGPRHRRNYAKVSSSPIKHIIITQSHHDHVGGLPAFAEAGAEVIAQENLSAVRGYWRRLGHFYSRRSNKLWASVLGERPLNLQDRFNPKPDVLFEKEYRFEIGGRRLELHATPGGETLDSLVVWLPDERTVFTGNLFGPIFLHQPNLNTTRGDKPRSALLFVEAVRKVMALEPELLITGHGDPIHGAERIQADLQKLCNSVLYLHDETVRRMNEGQELRSIMREVILPSELKIGEGHGKAAWNIRAIWCEYTGWFEYDATTSLYDVPASSVAGDLVELAGADALINRARAHLAASRPLEALHIIDVVLHAAPTDREALQAKVEAHEQILAGKPETFSETMWLKSEISAAQAQLAQGPTQ